MLWGLSSDESPLSEEVFSKVIRQAFDIDDAEAELPGSRHICNKLREALRENVFVADCGAQIQNELDRLCVIRRGWVEVDDVSCCGVGRLSHGPECLGITCLGSYSTVAGFSHRYC